MSIDSNIKHVKILFRFVSNITEEEAVETMWANIVDANQGRYQLDSIPFYGPLVSSDDIVQAQFDEKEGMLTYRKTIKSSGNSTVQVILNKKDEIEGVRNEFKKLDCTSEKINPSFFAMEIPLKINYREIKLILEKKSDEGILEYAEPSLSQKHCQDIT